MKTYILLLILMTLFCSCSSIRLTSSWKSEQISPIQYKKILVLGLIRDADRSIQENMEKHLAEDLIAHGIAATTSLKEFGPKAFENLDEAAALDKLKALGIEAVITIVLLDKQKERNYVPGYINYSPYGIYYSQFWGYRTALYQRIYEPGYYVTNTKFFWESNFYEMSNKQLIYSVQTQSFDLDNSNKLGHQYGQLIVNDMIKKGIVINN